MKLLYAIVVALSLPASAQPARPAPPAQPPLDPKLVEPGKNWWCATGEEPRECYRDRDECVRSNSDNPCRQAAKVFAYTQGARPYETDASAAAYTTAAGCVKEMRLALRQTPAPSKCQAVGATTLPPITAADAPGKGWYCFDRARDGFWDCSRAQTECNARRNGQLSKEDGAPLGECTQTDATMWAFREGHLVSAFSTRAACEQMRPTTIGRLLATECAELP